LAKEYFKKFTEIWEFMTNTVLGDSPISKGRIEVGSYLNLTPTLSLVRRGIFPPPLVLRGGLRWGFYFLPYFFFPFVQGED